MNIALSPLDMTIVVLYLLGVTALGLWYSRGIKSSKDYFLAGRSLPWWAVGMSLVVSDIGAKDMVGLATDGYRYGIVMMNFDFIGCAFPVLVAAFLFMPFFWMAGVYTIPEYLGRRYSQQVRTCFAVLWAVFMIGTVGTIFVSAAAMFEGLLGWHFWLSVGVTGILVAAYTTAGGLKAVVVTDALSCVVLIGGAALICIFGLMEVGGFSGLHEKVASLEWTEHHFQMVLPADHPEYPWLAVLLGLGLVQGPAYWIGNQAIVQRALGSKSQAQARASYLFCAVIKLVFPVLLVVPGLIAVALFHDKLGRPDATWQGGGQVLPMLLVRLLHPGVLGLVLGAFMAGVLSNLDSYVNSASTLLVSDLYRPFFSGASDAHCLRVGRWLVVVLLSVGAAASYLIQRGFGSVFEAFQVFMTFFQGPLLALLLLGMLTQRATAPGGFAGMLLGVGTAMAMHSQRFLFGREHAVSFLWVAWWSFVAALLGTIVVSFVTRPYDQQRLRGLVCWLPSEEQKI
ncbi:MAG: sodium/solute symporter [Thermoguttaceae bacterium]|jgi:SSS family solute:Na+ symporter|nr:sodium/solute symporter [Thermoguttaceae bacterium]